MLLKKKIQLLVKRKMKLLRQMPMTRTVLRMQIALTLKNKLLKKKIVPTLRL
jgi:hypothetical protein